MNPRPFTLNHKSRASHTLTVKIFDAHTPLVITACMKTVSDTLSYAESDSGHHPNHINSNLRASPAPRQSGADHLSPG